MINAEGSSTTETHPAWLDAVPRNRHAYRVSRPDGRSCSGRKACGRGKSGLHRHAVPD